MSVVRPKNSLKRLSLNQVWDSYLFMKMLQIFFEHQKEISAHSLVWNRWMNSPRKRCSTDNPRAAGLGQIKLFFTANTKLEQVPLGSPVRFGLFGCSRTSATCKLPACWCVVCAFRELYLQSVSWNALILFPGTKTRSVGFPALSLCRCCAQAAVLPFFIFLPAFGTNTPFQSLHPVGL